MKAIVFGCGGHARSIINTFCINNIYQEIILVDKNAEKNEKILGFSVKKNYELDRDDVYIIAIGDNTIRKEMYNKLQNNHIGNCISVVSNSSHIGLDVSIGKGTFIAPYVYIGPQTSVGINTIINTGCVVEHESVIGSHTHIAPHVTICGRTNIGNNVFCGAGSTVIDKINVCDNVIIGAGAVVICDIVESGTYVGIPARKIS